jgi:drug/metabolite transporter (DMT)-like permease
MLYALIALMVFFWAANFSIAKFALREFPPLLLSGLRLAIAAALIVPLYFWERRRKTERPVTLEDLRLLAVIGVVGVALNQVFFVFGLSRTSVAHSAIVIGLTPMVVLVLAAMKGQEHISARKAVGMCIALGGIGVLKGFEAPHPGGGGPTWTGDLLTFAAITMFAVLTVFGKAATQRHSPVKVNAFAYVGAAVGLAPFAGWQAWRFGFAQVSLAAWASLLYMAMFSSVVCYLIYYHALTHMAPSRVSAFSYLQPPLASGLGVLALGEPLTVPLVAATAIVLFGVFLTERG